MRSGFLKVDVFTCPQCHESSWRMPMVRCRDYDGIKLLHFEHPSDVVRTLRFFARHFLHFSHRLIHYRTVDITYAGNFYIRVLCEHTRKREATAVGSHHTGDDLVVGRASETEHTGGDK